MFALPDSKHHPNVDMCLEPQTMQRVIGQELPLYSSLVQARIVSHLCSTNERLHTIAPLLFYPPHRLIEEQDM
jgi:hypothetical protein